MHSCQPVRFMLQRMEFHQTLVLHVCPPCVWVCMFTTQPDLIWVSIPQGTGFLMVCSPIMDTSSCGHRYMNCVLPFLDLSLVHPCPTKTGFIVVIAITTRCLAQKRVIKYNYHHSTKLYRKYHEFVAVCIVTNAQHE